MKLQNIITIRAQIECLTGLHIGGGDSQMQIGGIDAPVVKHPYTKQPYIPGSSIKGKMRSLLEWYSGHVQKNALGVRDYERSNHNPQVLNILKLFGVSGDNNLEGELREQILSSRLGFYDCPLASSWIEERKKHDQLLTEEKAENVINRITGVADNPRFFERVPSGALFDFTCTLKILRDDERDALLSTFITGLKLLQMDAIGKAGSRGYGKIRFNSLIIDGTDASQKLAQLELFKAA